MDLQNDYIDLKVELKKLQKQLQHTNKNVNTNKPQLEIKNKQKKGQCGGSSHWPLWVVQLILEQLVNGAPPSYIASNIASQAALTDTSIHIQELPCLTCGKGCCTILRIIGETLTAYCLAKAKEWQ
eukprot:475268-Ditylum_brightwellii.AAC.1